MLSPTRIYDPASGRFVQNEPLFSRKPFAHYLYAAQNPISLVDPFGLANCPVLCDPTPPKELQDEPSGPVIKAWEPNTLESLEIAIRRAWEKYVEGYWLQRWSSPSAEAGARLREEHKQYLIDRTPQATQVIFGSIEIATGVATGNPFLVVHGIDVAGTGIVGWDQGRPLESQTAQLVDWGMSLYGASEQNKFLGKLAVEGILPAAAPSI